MKRIVILGVLSLLAMLTLVACGGTTAEPTATTTGSTNAQPAAPAAAQSGAAGNTSSSELYVFLPKSLDNPYWVACQKGMSAEATKLGVRAEFLGPDTADAAKQVAIFESVIARKPAGIAVSPNDPGTVKDSIAKARAAGIPVISWDADAPDSQRIAYVGTDNVAAGKTAGDELANAINKKGKVAILTGSLTALNANQRVEGFKDAMKNYPDIQIVATEPTEDSLATALSKAETLMQANPDLAAFYGVTGSGVPGAGNAVKQANKCGTIKVVGFDVVPQGIDLMKAGCVQALISQRPFGMTVKALDLLQDLHNGKQASSTNIDTGVEVVHPDTLDKYLTTDH
ncbi:MAG TPA: sugar-binding protein [Chloroflexota bacterium]